MVSLGTDQGTYTILSSIINRMKFPSVLIVYQSITHYVLIVFVLIGYVEKDKLFCSSADTFESFENPTVFCTITGTIKNVVKCLNYWLIL